MMDDKQILHATRQIPNEEHPEQVKMEFDLPSGETLSSEWLPHDKLKAQVLIGWCELVRETIKEDAAREAREEELEAVEADTPPKPEKSPEGPVAGPEAYIRDQLMRAEQEAIAADSALLEAQTRLNEAEQAYEQWKTVAESLKLEDE